jgi:hypothetical protein
LPYIVHNKSHLCISDKLLFHDTFSYICWAISADGFRLMMNVNVSCEKYKIIHF